MTTAPRGRPGPALATRDSAIIAGRHLRLLGRNPSRMVYPLVQPVVLLVLFVSVLSNIAAVAGESYRQFLMPGIIIQNVALTAPTTGLAAVRDAASGLADRFRSLPIPRSSALIGRLAFDGMIFFAQAAVMIAVGGLFGFRVRTGVPGMAAIAADAVAFGVATGTACTWLALRMGDPETAERALFLPMVPLAFVSSAYAPIERLAGWLQPVARINPVTAAVDVARSLASGGPLAGPLWHLAVWVAVLSVLPGIAAVRRWQAPT